MGLQQCATLWGCHCVCPTGHTLRTGTELDGWQHDRSSFPPAPASSCHPDAPSAAAQQLYPFSLFFFFFFPSGTPFVPRPSCRLVHRAGIGLAVRRDSQGSSFLQSPPGNGVPVTLLVPCKVRGLPGAAKGLHPSGMVPWWQLLRGTRAESLQCSC